MYGIFYRFVLNVFSTPQKPLGRWGHHFEKYTQRYYD